LKAPLTFLTAVVAKSFAVVVAAAEAPARVGAPLRLFVRAPATSPDAEPRARTKHFYQ